MDGPLAVDATRAFKLTYKGYTVMTKKIPEQITPKNRLLMAYPNDEESIRNRHRIFNTNP